MRIWVTRHGRTALNEKSLMQGHTDAPLTEEGIGQAREARKRIGDVQFDAVYSSPLERAVVTAGLIGNVEPDRVIKDPRLIEMDFGKYELCSYYHLGAAMSLYWLFPDVIPVPDTVEDMESMTLRVADFFKDLERKDYRNVLISTHGAIMRIICGYLYGRPKGIYGRLLPKNCEVRVFDLSDYGYTYVKTFLPEKKG